MPSPRLRSSRVRGRLRLHETDDQNYRPSVIKADMEKPVPMDRLLCGDVGAAETSGPASR